MSAKAAIVAGARASGGGPPLEIVPALLLGVDEALGRLGIDVERLVNPAVPELLQHLDQVLARLSAQSDDAALVLYLVGHGEFNGLTLRLHLSDGYVPIDQILEKIAWSGVSETVIFIESCSAGTAKEIAQAVFEHATSPKRIAVITSSVGPQVSFEGVFGHALISALAAATSPFAGPHVAPRALFTAIQSREPQHVFGFTASDAVEDRHFIALPNPQWRHRRQKPWSQAEAADPRWAYQRRRKLEGRLDRALSDPAAHGGEPEGPDGVTILAAPPDSGKSTVLRWLASPSARRTSGVDATLYVDCRLQTVPEIEQELKERLDVGDGTLVEWLANRTTPVRVILDEADEAGDVLAFARELARTRNARVVVATSSADLGDPGFSRGDRVVDLRDTELTAEGVDARRRLAVKMLRGAGPQRDAVVEEVLAAAAGSFLLVYLYSSTGAARRPRGGAGAGELREVLLGAYLKAIELALNERLGNDPLRGSTRKVIMPLALAEGMGLPSAELWAHVAEEPDLKGRELSSAVLEALGPALESSVDREGNVAWRLQPMHLVSAARQSAEARQTHLLFAEYLLDVLDRASVHGAELGYARRYLAVHLSNAGELGRIAEVPTVLLALSRERLIQSLQRAGTEELARLAACLQLAAEGEDAVEQLALAAGAHRLDKLMSAAGQECRKFTSRWLTHTRARGLWRAGRRALVEGAVDAVLPLVVGIRPDGDAALVDAVATDSEGVVVATARGALLRWSDGEGRPIAHLGRGVQSLDVSGGRLTVAYPDRVVVQDVGDPSREPEELGWPDVLRVRRSQGTLFALGADTLWRRNEEHEGDPLGLPDGGPFLGLTVVKEGVIASTGAGGLWLAETVGAWRRLWRGEPGSISFDVLDDEGARFVATCEVSGRVGVHELRHGGLAPVHEVTLHEEYDVDRIVLRGRDEVLLSTRHGVVSIKFSRTDGEDES